MSHPDAQRLQALLDALHGARQSGVLSETDCRHGQRAVVHAAVGVPPSDDPTLPPPAGQGWWVVGADGGPPRPWVPSAPAPAGALYWRPGLQAWQAGVPARGGGGALVQEYRVGGVAFQMRAIQPGRFWMGSPADEEGRHPDEERHEVTLTRRFAVGVTPVTQALYTAVTGRNPSRFAAVQSRPVETVSWFDAVQFCNALSILCGLDAAYQIGDGDEPSVRCDFTRPGFRLPTEAEWEYAARGGQAHVYAGSDDPAAVAWLDRNSGERTHPVGQKAANGYGLYDMSGNVWEWVWDWYGEYSGASTDPQGPASGSGRVGRGGSWGYSAVGLRVAFRFDDPPAYRLGNLGFRLARTLP